MLILLPNQKVLQKQHCHNSFTPLFNLSQILKNEKDVLRQSGKSSMDAYWTSKTNSGTKVMTVTFGTPFCSSSIYWDSQFALISRVLVIKHFNCLSSFLYIYSPYSQNWNPITAKGNGTYIGAFKPCQIWKWVQAYIFNIH